MKDLETYVINNKVTFAKKKLEQAIGKCMLTEDLSTKSEHNFTDIFIKSSFHMESE